ncbi:hypothetical protein F4803DRAFT_313365 [Xylaria telfairii]|nr:hypothetical protein F4803DRAFT_313365 [Xylaria telfairii]
MLVLWCYGAMAWCAVLQAKSSNNFLELPFPLQHSVRHTAYPIQPTQRDQRPVHMCSVQKRSASSRCCIVSVS